MPGPYALAIGDMYDFNINKIINKSRIAIAKAAFNKKRAIFTNTLGLKLRKKLVKCYIWSIAIYGVETWTLRAVDQKHLESFEMWCWRRMEKIIWTNHVRKEEVLLRAKEQRNILLEINKRKVDWSHFAWKLSSKTGY